MNEDMRFANAHTHMRSNTHVQYNNYYYLYACCCWRTFDYIDYCFPMYVCACVCHFHTNVYLYSSNAITTITTEFVMPKNNKVKCSYLICMRMTAARQANDEAVNQQSNEWVLCVHVYIHMDYIFTANTDLQNNTDSYV